MMFGDSSPSEIASQVAEALQGRRSFKVRYLLLGTALFMAVFMYRYAVDMYDPNKDIFKQLWRSVVRQDYNFYSGSSGGFYIRMGEALEARTKHQSLLRVHNHSTSGAIENARQVMSNPASFGVVQEDTLPEGDFIRDHVRYVTPLYLERMHIIYDTQAYDRMVAEYRAQGSAQMIDQQDEDESDGAEVGQPAIGAPITPRRRMLILGSNVSPEVKYFFQNARVSTGPVGSGSRLFARYILNFSDVGPVDDASTTFSDALERLRKDDSPEKIDIVFTIAGAPLDGVTNVLKEGRGRYRLMSIDPAAVTAMNQQFDFRLESATFKDKYNGGESVSTIGSWAFLICSKDVPDRAIMNLLAELELAKPEIQHAVGVHNRKAFQLDEFGFYDAFQRAQEGYFVELFRNFMIFLFSVSFIGTAILVFLSWTLSGVRKIRFFRSLTDIYRDCLPENTNLEARDGALPRPVIYSNQTTIINQLIHGMSRLLIVARAVRESYNDGAITMTHYRHLLSNIDEMRDIFKRHLAQRLNEYYVSSGLFDPLELRHYYTAGYLSLENYRDLETRFTVEAIPSNLPSDNGRPPTIEAPGAASEVSVSDSDTPSAAPDSSSSESATAPLSTEEASGKTGGPERDAVADSGDKPATRKRGSSRKKTAPRKSKRKAQSKPNKP